ncbi:MAG TPA: aminotransferase class IV [Thermoanaerobaculia bacterium]|nr:aminotransferase class IV [Thermoanaerobaculia bacterium]
MSAPAPALCLLDGEVLPLTEARVSPLDRGFLFGDGVYEVARIVGGGLVFWEEHRRRLADGLAATRIAPAGGVAAVERGLGALLAAAAVEEGSLYLQVTRGAGPREKIPPPTLAPTLFAFASAHGHPAPASRPQTAIAHDDHRWGRCDVKSISLMGSVLGKLAARDAGADEVLFVGSAGEVREGGSTTFLVVQDGALVTHPLGRRILPGVTRAALLAAAADLGLPVEERPPLLSERAAWQEAMTAATLLGVQPVVRLDGEPVGGGEPGPWTRRLAEAVAAREPRHLTRLPSGAAAG